ncbi:hypothetical protein TNCV_1245461 [Trichonephila clavipes]|nr:hypothetical protein TNCV_1245461 [Trichonephila clavipes]
MWGVITLLEGRKHIEKLKTKDYLKIANGLKVIIGGSILDIHVKALEDVTSPFPRICRRLTDSAGSDEAHFWLNGYVNKQKCRIWSEANPQVYVETPLHPEKLTVWCALWAGGILLQKR